MKPKFSIKTFFSILLLFCISKSYSQFYQKKEQIEFEKIKNDMDSIFSRKEAFKMDLNISRIKLQNDYLSFYNKNTGLNDNYFIYKSNTNYSNSILMNNNNILNFKQDSFNPIDTNKIGIALFIGTINLFLKK